MAYEFKCPHCEAVLYEMNSSIRNIGCPIRICPECKKEYNYPFTYDWSIISPFHKFYYCFLANGRIFLALFAATEIANKAYSSALILGLVWVSVSILRLAIFDRQNIKDSYRRTKDNPEYIQKLSDLGCSSIDIRIDPYYK